MWGSVARILGLCLILLLGAEASAQEARPFPLAPPDRSSPRATLQSFVENNVRGARAVEAGAPGDEVLFWFQRADASLDLGEVSLDQLENVRTETGLLLYEVLTRVGLPDLDDVPDAAEVATTGQEVWFLPGTEIAIHLVTEGDFAGAWLFSPRTVSNALSYFKSVAHLPVQSGMVPGTYQLYVDSPNLPFPYRWVQSLPLWLRVPVLENVVWKWLAVGAVLSLGVLAIRLALAVGRRLDDGEAPDRIRPGLSFAAGVGFATPLIAQHLIDEVIGFRFLPEAVVSRLLYIGALVAALVLVMAVTELCATLLVRSRAGRGRPLNRNLVFVLARIFGIFLALLLVLQWAEFFGVQLAPLLAGIGVGGLALALAVRPTLENVIGGLTLFADRPLRVGDYCRFGDEEGTIEEIGLRSTRVRRLDEKLISVPNSELAQLKIVNFGLMRQRLYRTKIALRYETTAPQLEAVLSGLNQMLEAHPDISPVRRHVRFLSFDDYALGLELFAYTKTTDWIEHRRVVEDLNLRIMQIVTASGTGFAFPSQTTYVGRDTPPGQALAEAPRYDQILGLGPDKPG